ncbi:exodeoxyribonuclease V subunit gamma [Vibrio sp. D431a]|uniref:exodeoxyribonuclease V subunit gamma n=1 Tax=Vibrio sp. D431a TaxID=2837388 RepID=UPI0025553E7D|nr:exodeoxyribonuclease V subunit gamma [Vibrio sp. D431a]MDK9793294.1 exodeoxyribonuclease V subunit gamma [Vibrio sp. D431a]
MFTVYNSNQMDLLRELVLKVSELAPRENVFQEDVILVQTPGMAQWVKQSLADRFGICANTKFPMPSSFIWNVLYETVPDVPKESAFTKDSIKWALNEILPEVIELDLYEPLKNYMTSGDVTPTKLHQLSGKVADVYDKYLVYRPDWISDWERGEVDQDLVQEHPWQPDLWNRIHDHMVQLGKSPYHRANMFETFIETLNNYAALNQPLSSKIPKRVCVVGVSSLPPSLLDAFVALGEHIDILYMNLNPSHFYWGDIKNKGHVNKLLLKQYQQQLKNGEFDSTPIEIDETLANSYGNSLLSSMGTLGRDQNALFAEREVVQGEAFSETERSTLLKCIQNDIFNLEDKGDPQHYEDSSIKDIVATNDDSLSIHQCYSSMREIEALHNYVLDCLNSDPELTPKDIIVMVPDINEYSAYIDAVFGNVPFWDNKYIPYSVSDKTANNEYPIVATYLELLKLNESRFSATEVMEILKNKSVLNKLDLTQEDYDEIYVIVKDVAIRWGMDSQHTDDNGDVQINVNTWKTGISRMLMGYALDSDHGFFEGILPYNAPMGTNPEILGKLSEFISLLETWANKLQGCLTGDEWLIALTDLLGSFFEVKENSDMYALNLVKASIRKLYRTLRECQYDSPISLNIVRMELEDVLTSEQTSQQFLAGKLNFCTLMPMRSIPFKLVCIVGLNDGIFPRTQTAENYDLTAFFPRLGDKSRRNEDRYMFLEALLSAQEKLYISYISKSDKDGSSRIPSIIVQELLDYIHSGYCLEGETDLPADISGENLIEHLCTQHAMTPYSPNEFTHNGGSYNESWANAINSVEVNESVKFDDNTLPPTEESVERLNLTELLTFWKSPVKQFFNRRLKADLTLQSNALNDFEPFEFDPLENHKLKASMLKLMSEMELSTPEGEIAEKAVKSVLEIARGRGISPVGHYADLMMEEEALNVLNVNSYVQSLCVGEEKTYEISIPTPIDKYGIKPTLAGVIKGGYEDRVCDFKVGKVHGKDLLEGFIKQIALSLMSHRLEVYVIGTDKSYMFEPMEKELCEALLITYVEAYFDGLSKPYPYLQDFALICAKAIIQKGSSTDTEDLCMTRMKAHYERTYAENGTFPEPHVRRVWSDWDEMLGRQFYITAAKHLEPALKQAKELE